MGPKKLMARVAASDARGMEIAVLRLVLAHADQNHHVDRAKFPLRMGPGRALSTDSPILKVLVDAGVVTLDHSGLFLDPSATIRFLSKREAEAASNTISNSVYEKNHTRTSFVFEEVPGQEALAFISAFGPRVRRGLLQQVAGLDHELAQQILHEVGAVHMQKGLDDPATYAFGIVRKARVGQFRPAKGLRLADELDAILEIEENKHPSMASVQLLRRVK